MSTSRIGYGYTDTAAPSLAVQAEEAEATNA